MLRVYPDLESLSQAAAGLFLRHAAQCVKTRGRFSVVLSGGATPRRTYELLAQPPFRDRVAWSRIHVFWGDERCVPPDDPRSNAGMARKALLTKVPIPPAQIHPMLCGPSPKAVALAYEKTLRSHFAGSPPRFDLIFLGLGADGHTASLFPGETRLLEGERWVAAVHPPGRDLPRITLTPAIINQAWLVAFLVAGADKAAILKKTLQGPGDPPRLPAQLIKPISGKIHWLVDQSAADF